MWSHFIILDSPSFDESPGFGQACKPVQVQALISELAVETLDESVVHRTAWSDEVKLDSSPVCPLIEGVAGEFSPVVRGNDLGLAIPDHRPVKRLGYRVCRESLVNLKTYAFSTHMVDGCEDSQTSPIGQLIAHEVDTPMLTRLNRWQRSQASLSRSLLVALGPHQQAFLAVDPVDSLVIHKPAFSLEQHRQPPVAIPRPGVRELLQAHP